ncbi:MAG: hypothetical protein HZB56_13095 [Deltaproteobacteria bacterium]|nr:hypothetical protein [Deltaproteobacteria bacterium]
MTSLATIAAALLVAATPQKGKAKKKVAPAAARQAVPDGEKAAAGMKLERKPGKPRPTLGGQQPSPGNPLPLRPRPLRPLDQAGTVRNVILRRAYLDAGTRDGLAVGQVLQLRRKGEAAGTCTIEAVSERNAVCAGGGVRSGDTFPVNPAAAGARPADLPPRPSAEEQARRLQAIGQVGFALVDFKSTRVVEIPDRLRRVDLGFTHVSFLGSDRAADHQEQVYAVARGVPLWRGSRLDLDLTAIYRRDAADPERFEPGKKALVLVREASLSWAEPAATWRFAAGRVLPWYIPGGATFDGVQAGWRPSREAELGLFGGAVPDLMTTAPGVDRATGGAYWHAERQVGGHNLLRTDGRVAWVKLPASKSRIEAEASFRAWLLRHLDVAGQVRFGMGDYTSPNKLDAARIDVGWVQPQVWSVYGGFRYDDTRVPDLAAPALYAGRTRHASGAFSFDRLGWLQLRATGGHAEDPVSKEKRSWVGPEVWMPRALGRWGGAGAGYSEQIGKSSGRSAWVQADLAPGTRFRMLTRASWFMDERPSPLQADHGVGLMAAATADLTPWLRFRLSAMGRYAIPPSEAAPSAWGSLVSAGIEGRY